MIRSGETSCRSGPNDLNLADKKFARSVRGKCPFFRAACAGVQRSGVQKGTDYSSLEAVFAETQ